MQQVRGFVTRTMRQDEWQRVLHAVVEVLRQRAVERLHIEYGWIVGRDLRGEPQPEDTDVPLADLESFIESGLSTGAIEWAKQSDFVFRPASLDASFLLCNDADLHVDSSDESLLTELEAGIQRVGVSVEHWADGTK